MNGCQSSTESYSERQYNLQRVSDFHAVLLGMAAHDLRQPLQVIQSTYEWLSGRFDDDVERMRLQRGERAVSRRGEQLDRLAAALRLYEQTTSMKLSPVPLAPIFDGVRTENVELAPAKRTRIARPSDPRHRREQRRPARLHCAKSSAQCDQIYQCWTRPAFLPSA